MGIDTYEIIVIGCGKMGSALAGGLIKSGVVEADSLHLCDRDGDKAGDLAASTGGTRVDPDQVFDWATGERRLFIVAVKPGDVGGLLERGREAFTGEDTVVSLAAGVPTDLLEEWAGPEPAIVRAMPNTPALIGRGITGVFGKRGADMETVRTLFEGVGEAVELKKEADFDALTAVSGSGPAYVFVAIEALADGAVSMGLDRETAIELATETIAGSGLLAADSDLHTAELKDAVASPGGTTITGLTELEDRGFRGELIEAVRAAAEKSEELTEQLLSED
ncbi:MAG: pyrroline-5-carboxylate reductase [Bradymonadaceae bacterium]